jgi:hypothetical protein
MANFPLDEFSEIMEINSWKQTWITVGEAQRPSG